MEKVEPDSLDVKYGGFGRTSWQIRWEGGKLVWRRFAAEWTEVALEEIQPESQSWVDFWQSLDKSKVWDWNEVYYRAAERAVDKNSPADVEATEKDPAIDPDEVISWSVSILLKDGRLIDSSGSNAVPGATRRTRRGRGRGRGGPPSKREPAAEKPDSKNVTDDTVNTATADPSNVGIPTDTFDQFIDAVKALIGGREFADILDEQAPETLPTQYRTLTPRRANRPDPFAQEELETQTKKTRRRKKIGKRSSTSGRKQTTRVGENKSENKTGQRKRTRRKPTRQSEQGEKVASENAEGAPRRRRKRRRSRKKGDGASVEGNSPQVKKTTTSGPQSGQPTKEGDGTGQKKKRRRRRRRRKPGGGPGGDSSSDRGPTKNSGGSGTSGTSGA